MSTMIPTIAFNFKFSNHQNEVLSLLYIFLPRYYLYVKGGNTEEKKLALKMKLGQI